MSHYQPSYVTGFHSCDREIGLKVLNGTEELIPSNNTWDWLGKGIYFWEHNPGRALEYAVENARGLQFNKTKIKIPFVLGANIELGNCLNLVEMNSLLTVKNSYKELLDVLQTAGADIPLNKGNNRALDCAVFRFIHDSFEAVGRPAYDTIRCAFPEGGPIYPTASFMDRLHIQIAVINVKKITGYFLPKPIETFNPYLQISPTP